jgi:pimeloyl-ACP methyl ester carboxylesterase
MKLLIGFLLSAIALCQGGASSVDGLWQGTLNAGPLKLRVVLHLNGATGKFDSVDQGALGLPIETVSLKDRAVTMSMSKLNATFAGTLSADGNEIDGTFTQGVALPLVLRRIDTAPDMTRPQDPKKPYPYIEEEVVVDNAKAKVKLAGTITIPKGKGPFPAVVMITGSGPQDRDEALMGHRPFLVIADQLTRNGIAVLRVDDRGIGKSTGDFTSATTADFATDTLACVEFLKARGDIDHAHIGLIGHSEGGVIAPIAAAQSNDVAFIVMMAGTAVPGNEVLFEQQKLIGKSMGIPGSLMEDNRKFNEQLYAILAQDIDTPTAAKKVEDLYKARMASMNDEQRKAFQPMMESQMKQATTAWFRYFLKYDPGPTLRKVRCPVLAMNGELDLQVSPAQNLPALAKALEDGGNTDYEIVKLAKLNHLFQTATTGSPGEYAAISETVSPVALDLMTAWILRHTH